MLKTAVERIQQSIRSGAFVNEAAISTGVVLPILKELGWDVFDPSRVSPEFTVGTRRVDFALRARGTQPDVFVEVKRLGQTDGGETQLFEYAFLQGVRLALLTDGQQWDFFLPGEAGSLDERRVYRLDVLERAADESVERLSRYLSFDRVLSGEAFNAARSDISDLTRERQITQALPKALEALIREPDPSVVDALQARVADLCGYQPDLDTCERFLAGAHIVGRAPVAAKEATPSSQVATAAPSPSGFVWQGQQVACHSARGVLLEVLRRLAQRDPDFLRRFVARKHGKKRRYVAQDRLELYPGAPHLVETHSEELLPGWWVGTNYSRRNIDVILRLACEVAAVDFNSLAMALGE